MSEWWTYSLQDFLMFAPATYQRLFALHNTALWPAQLLMLPLGLLACGVLAWRPARWRLGCLLIAAGWLATAWGFHWQHLGSIHTAAPWLAALSALQMLVLCWIARPASPWAARALPAWTRRGGLWLLAIAVVLWPWLGPLQGRPWQQAALFGLTPDATALGTLGLLLCLRRAPGRGAVGRISPAGALPWALPLLWCLASAATLWTLRMDIEAALMAGVALVAVVCGWRATPRGLSAQVPPT